MKNEEQEMKTLDSGLIVLQENVDTATTTLEYMATKLTQEYFEVMSKITDLTAEKDFIKERLLKLLEDSHSEDVIDLAGNKVKIVRPKDRESVPAKKVRELLGEIVWQENVKVTPMKPQLRIFAREHLEMLRANIKK